MMDAACASKIVQKYKSQTILEKRAGEQKKNCGIQVLGPGREKLFTYSAIQKKKKKEGMTKVVEQEDLENNSSQWHTKITTIYRTTVYENDLKTSINDKTKAKKKETQKNGQKWWRWGIVKTHTPGRGNPRMGG